MSQSLARKKNARSSANPTVLRNESGPYTHIVVGDGSVALWTLGAVLAKRPSGEAIESQSVLWLKGAGAQVFPPVAFLSPDSAGMRLIQFLGAQLGWTDLEFEEGQFLREFRNKAFREPTWCRSKVASQEQQLADREDSLWKPEREFAPLKQIRVHPDLGTLENRLRHFLASHLNCFSLANTPVQEVEHQEDGTLKVRLGNGKTVLTENLVFADRWSALAEVAGLPKPLGFMRGRDPHCVLQAVFTHDELSVPASSAAPLEWNSGSGVPSAAKKMTSLSERPTGLTFFTSANKDSGETIERQVWGYFMENGRQSVWSIVMEREESEDNHHVAKKLRRIHQAVEKMFSAKEESEDTGAVPASTGSTVPALPILEERVSFEESRVFAAGTSLKEPLALPKLAGFWVTTDGYGPSSSLAQVESLCEKLGLDLSVQLHSDSESEAMNLSGSTLNPEDLATSSEGASGSHEVIY